MATTSDSLTDTAIRQAKPKAKSYKLSDGGGLYLEVMPNGSKYWRQKYRINGKEKRLALGVYPEVSLKEARTKRDAARKHISNSVDPGELKRTQKTARAIANENNFQSIALEWHTKKKPGWSDTHALKTLRLLERDLFPTLGARPAGDITSPELLATLRRIEARGAADTAHRAKWVAGQIMRYAVATGRAERDPAADLKDALATPVGGHMAAITEPAEVGKLLQAMDGYHGSPVVRAAMKLAPLVFVRPGELRTMEWAHIDFDACEWRYTVSRTQHIVPLCTQAIDVLHSLAPLTGRGKYVFPSGRGASRPMSDNAIRMALRTLGYTNEQMTTHGFRAMARTLLDEVLGFRVDWIEHQLAHGVKDPNGRAYNRTAHLDGRREMMQAWADYLDNLRAVARGENVVAANFKRA